MEMCNQEGDIPVRGWPSGEECWTQQGDVFKESGCLRVQPEMGGILHLRLNMGGRPIANKYREGKMQRTLKREFKELEVVEREAIPTSKGWWLLLHCEFYSSRCIQCDWWMDLEVTWSFKLASVSLIWKSLNSWWFSLVLPLRINMLSCSDHGWTDWGYRFVIAVFRLGWIFSWWLLDCHRETDPISLGNQWVEVIWISWWTSGHG